MPRPSVDGAARAVDAYARLIGAYAALPETERSVGSGDLNSVSRRSVEFMEPRLVAMEATFSSHGLAEQAGWVKVVLNSLWDAVQRGYPIADMLRISEEFSDLMTLALRFEGTLKENALTFEQDCARLATVDWDLLQPSPSIRGIVQAGTGFPFSTPDNLSMRDISFMRLLRLYPLGLTDRPVTHVDGGAYNPARFTKHDAGHTTSQVLQDRQVPLEQFVETVPEISRFLVELDAAIKGIDHVAHPKLRAAVDTVLFHFTHEHGYSYERLRALNFGGMSRYGPGEDVRGLFHFVTTKQFGPPSRLGEDPVAVTEKACRWLAGFFDGRLSQAMPPENGA